MEAKHRLQINFVFQNIILKYALIAGFFIFSLTLSKSVYAECTSCSGTFDTPCDNICCYNDNGCPSWRRPTTLLSRESIPLVTSSPASLPVIFSFSTNS